MATLPEVAPVDPFSCGFGQNTIENGGVAAIFAQSCVLLVCSMGTISNKNPCPPESRTCCEHGGEMFCSGQERTEDCRKFVCEQGRWEISGNGQDPKCCWYKGKLYEDGHLIPGLCIQIFCKNGLFTTTSFISDDCSTSKSYNDPHFSNYRNKKFDMHGTCNYSMSQIGRDIVPESGVFSQFRKCPGASFPSCVGQTTLREDENTIIHINNGVTEVNGCTFTLPAKGVGPIVCDNITYPVMAWKHGACFRLSGSHFMVQHCRTQISIWTPKSKNRLYGLMGPADDIEPGKNFIPRDPKLPLSGASSVWAQTWHSGDQQNGNAACPRPNPARPPKPIEEKPKPCEDAELINYNNSCHDAISRLPGARNLPSDVFDVRIISCAFDMCMLGDQNDRDDWLKEVAGMVQDEADIIQKTVPIYPTDTTDCYYVPRGTFVKDGDKMPNVCAEVVCNKGVWSPTGRTYDACSACDVYNDPHFKDYRNYGFDYHGTCNSSVSQIGKDIVPESGVFAQFKKCAVASLASCLGTTTLRENENTIIHIGTAGGLQAPGIYTIEVNGCAFTVPSVGSGWVECDGITYQVLSWRHGDCIRILGQHFLVQQCKNALNIWVHGDSKHVYGLCGPANDNQPMRFIPRKHTPPKTAPARWEETWNSGDQQSAWCHSSNLRFGGNEFVCEVAEMTKYKKLCHAILIGLPGANTFPSHEFETRKNACASDLCMIDNPNDRNKWLAEISVMFAQKVQVIRNTLNDTPCPEAQK